MLVEELVQEFAGIWRTSGAHVPQLGATYSADGKLSREAHLQQFLQTLESLQQRNTRDRSDVAEAEAVFFSALRKCLTSGLDFEDDHVDIILSHDFTEATQEFLTKARRFDPAIGSDDISQACRNVWVMNVWQRMLDLPVEVTPAVFAYSLLYPYTDNYLDDPEISAGTKTAFNARLSQRLAGAPVGAVSSREQIIFDLVGIIEAQYERSRHRRVFDSLLAIHRAQQKSLRLLDPEASLSEEDVLEISLEKGGASVLADGYLVSGSLTEPQERFLFGYGAYLQLADDLQDVQTDCDSGLLTVFSQASTHSQLDALTNRTYHFGNTVMECADCFGAGRSSALLNLMKRSVVMLLTGAVGLAERFYSESYVRELETYSPFRFSFLRKHRDNLPGYKMSAMKLLQEFEASNAGSPLDP
ncbi:MAG: hypothetical protein JSU70_04805 [Phycisphaerales bacterium]|nr:MAG: hypothetical protein JSU70_04805 [Phycisphaerales bacterium]